MIREIEGDIFDSMADAIVIPVNTVGVMGAELALRCKKKYPEIVGLYRYACWSGALRIGTVHVHRVDPDGPGLPHPRIICLPTKRDWKDPSKLIYVERGLIELRKQIAERSIMSVAIPALGCGNGGLAWQEVKQLICAQMDDIPGLDVEVYLPHDR